MRLALTLGAAIIALGAVTASAQQGDHDRVIIRHHGPGDGGAGGDANEDGYLSRDEAAAHADQMFAQLDSNDDGRLTRDDHQEHVMHFRHAPGAPNADDPNCERTESVEDGNRQITVICRTESGTTTTDDRTVIIRRGDGGGTWTREDGVTAPIAPVPPVPPVPPVFMFDLGDESEADINGDGALSREEFRAQQLRFFDARDVNGDRRVRAPRPPEPPVAPEAPRPPEPPRRR